MSDTKKVPSTDLRSSVVNLRSQAREILRMEYVSNKLQKLFYLNKDLKNIAKNIEDAESRVAKKEKNLAGAKFDLANINPEDPRAEVQTEALNKKIEEAQEIVDNANSDLVEEKAYAERKTNSTNKTIEKVNKDIEDMENGEKKVNIESIKEYTDLMIKNELNS
ncbi:MAG TPA: hypothetical protein VMZ91_00835 [Candidatus Paceibacterota bacterium]|nr:hypothetical protein [Candidatus Paceibacterota bacterium]